MGPGDFQNVFGALSVGLLAVLSGASLHWIASAEREHLYRWITRRRWIPRNAQSTFFIVLIMYCVGVLVQDFTDHLTDTEYHPLLDLHIYPPKLQQAILGSEEDLRFYALVRYRRNEGKWVLTGLGREVLTTDKKFVIDAADDDVKKAFLKEPSVFMARSDDDSAKVAKGFVCKLYYQAKNWAYNNPNYFMELEDIQRRIDFTRSSFLISTWTIIGLLILLVLILLEQLFNVRITPKLLFLASNRKFHVTPQQNQLRVLKTLAVVTAIGVISRSGYRNSENNFNERCFGYFVSHASATEITNSSPNSPSLLANLWLQTSAEYRAIALQTYQTAYERVKERVISGRRNSAKPFAVIMDLDETVLSNSGYQNYLQLNHERHSKELWNRWVEKGRGVTVVPGALEFIRSVRGLGVRVVFISNRPESLRRYTEKTLQHLGITEPGPDGRLQAMELLLERRSPAKDERREQVKHKFKVLAEVGDNLTDFSDEFNLQVSQTISSRYMRVDNHRSKWGTQWFVLPNPVYGDWTRFVDLNSPQKHLYIEYF